MHEDKAHRRLTQTASNLTACLHAHRDIAALTWDPYWRTSQHPYQHLVPPYAPSVLGIAYHARRLIPAELPSLRPRRPHPPSVTPLPPPLAPRSRPGFSSCCPGHWQGLAAAHATSVPDIA
eukprot:3123681-Rhodomonas_salina.2